MFKRFHFLFIILLMSVLPAAAQVGDDGVTVLICAEGEGCHHTEMSGEMSREEAEIVIGEDAPYDEDNVLVCDDAHGCYWSGTNAEETDESYGGDGNPADMQFDPEDMEGGIVPNDMAEWTIYYKQGIMDCNFITQPIPASEPHPARVELLADDGSKILLTRDAGNDLEMTRTDQGFYHGEVTVDGQTVNWDARFISPERMTGISYTTMISQGTKCDIQRYFWGDAKPTAESEEEQPESESESEEEQPQQEENEDPIS